MRWTGCLLGGLLLAQSVVKWEVHLDSAGKRVGDTITLSFRASIPPRYHVYSIRKTSQPANLPTEFTMDPQSRGLKLLGPLQEDGKLIQTYDPVFETDVYYFANEVKFVQRFGITGQSPRLSGALRYQYCDEEQCFFDKVEVDYTFSAGVRGGLAAQDGELTTRASPALPKKEQALALSPASKPDSGGSANANDGLSPREAAHSTDVGASSYGDIVKEDLEERNSSLWWLFLKAFLFGLAAVLTPCTFPMIPLTVSYFTKAQGGRASALARALWYAGSILIIFIVLGGLVTLIFGANAAYAISTNPWLNLVFFFILAAFGLSFLGLFEITLPASWTTATSRLSNTRSLLGIFFMALTLVLVSFSCIGPLLGTLLIDMVSGSYGAPLIGMVGFGLAFALPFGVLAGLPKLLQKLPRSGSWMDTFKVTLGFLELALALKFLSNADLVWHLGILDREIYLTAWIVLFLMLGLYLLGLLPIKGGKVEAISVPRLLLGMFSVGMGIYLFTGLWGAPLKAFSGFLPPVHEEIGVRVIGASTASPEETCPLPTNRKYVSLLKKHTPPGFCAFYDIEEAVAYAEQVRKPLLIDFTGHTCVNCRQVENSVWQEPTIRNLIQAKFILVSLFVDDQTPLDSVVTASDGTKLRTIGDQWLHFQKLHYNMQAQPYYVITDASLEPLVPPKGFTLDKEGYRAFLERGLRAYQQKYGTL